MDVEPAGTGHAAGGAEQQLVTAKPKTAGYQQGQRAERPAQLHQLGWGETVETAIA